MCNNSNNSCSSEKCRIAVTVEDSFGACTFPERFFDVTVSSRDGSTTLTGRVAGGSSAVFSVPCDKEYAVTVTGNVHSSPRAQTKRVNCCCGQTAGVTFIFSTFEPEWHPTFCPPCPCPPPCPPGPPCPQPCPPGHPNPTPCPPGPLCPQPCPPGQPCPPPHHPQPHPHPHHPVQAEQIENLCNIINEIISEE